MSRNRKQAPTAVREDLPAIGLEAEVKKPEAAWLGDHLRPAPVKTLAEVALREAVWSQFGKVEAMVRAFVGEKIDEGFTLDEILGLYTLESSVVPSVVADERGKPIVRFEARIVERVDDDGGAA